MRLSTILLTFIFTQSLFADFTERCLRYYSALKDPKKLNTEDNIFFHLEEIFKPKRKEYLDIFSYKDSWLTPLTDKENCRMLKVFVQVTGELDFSKTQINQPARKISSIKVLSKARELRTLNLSGHNIENLTPILQTNALEHLDVSGNQIPISDLDKLSVIQLRSLDVSHIILGNRLPNLSPSLEKLTARACSLHSSPELIEQVANAKNLQEIDLSYNFLTIYPPHLFSHPRLRTVILEGNQIREVDVYEGRNLVVNLMKNPLELQPIDYPSNEVKTDNTVISRPHLKTEEIDSLALSPQAIVQVLGASKVESIIEYAHKIARNGRADLLRTLSEAFTGNRKVLFDTNDSLTKATIKIVLDALSQKMPGQWLETLQTISELTDMNSLFFKNNDLFVFAANTPVVPAFKLFLRCLNDTSILKALKPRVHNQDSINDIDLAIAGIRPSDLTDRDDLEVALLMKQIEETTLDPKARVLIQNVCRSLGDARRQVGACRQDIASLEQMILTLSSNRVFLTADQEDQLNRNPGGMDFYLGLQGRITNYFYVAALVTTGSIPFNYESSMITSAMGITAKILEFTAAIVPVFGGIGKGLAIPFQLANMASDRADREKASTEFTTRADIGNRNLLKYLEIAKLYALAITNELATHRQQFIDPVKDANLAFQLFQASILLFGLHSQTQDQSALVKRIANHTVVGIKKFRESKPEHWSKAFREVSVSAMVEVFFEKANSEEFSTLLDKIADLVSETQKG